ncbi:ubiquinone biosynthesis protein COQ4 [Flavobacterium amniphilum]|uniref:ubiquinone biosynthesis protein COQ4 n=1 Tax=Flavobacterium amniphilum TaxID=1834035 RepID=UPI00202A887F|nr:ubiquinone biosynthesis protein COQ4 [Flavobacterium amniphilum]MCL9806836.1 ubiquinone biosynthesis protein COQ4 [Flavobacterium amniphilum]
MNLFQKTARKIIKLSFDFSVSSIERFNDMKPFRDKVSGLRNLENGTLGKEIADCLDCHRLTLVPGYESHDLKHVLLDYKMTAEDEIRMQAFMLGNGNHTLPCFAILIFGAILLPDLWLTFYTDFKKGRNSIPVSGWNIETHAQSNLEELRLKLNKPEAMRPSVLNLKSITKFGAFASITAGVFGMLFCLPFLFSSNLADLVGAGFPFVGGAILAVGGLLALSNLSRPKENQVVTVIK